MIELSTINLRCRTLFSHLCLGWLMCVVLAACVKDVPVPESAISSSDLGLSLHLGFPDPLTVTTRANPVKNGIELTDVRVLQFPVAGGDDVKNKLYSEAENGAPWYTQESGGALITVNTGSNDFTNVNCRFYIVANAGTDLSAVATENNLKSSSLSFTDITSEPDILTFGPVDYTKVEGATKPVALLAKLCRSYAKVTVKYTLATGIEITSVDIENVPDKIYPFPEVAADGSSPSVSPVGYLSTFSITPAGDSKEVTFYMPENLKGNGSATTGADKNLPAKGPGGTLEGCTCIVLKGTYDYYPGDAGSAPIGVEYRFYPGSDMVRNYDVERGKHYMLTINLKGANSADARVNITDGNVFTFDDPDNVDNEMDFK